MKFPKTRYYKSGNMTASLERNRHGYTISYARNGKHFRDSDYYIRDGWTLAVGRIEALRELKRNHFTELKK